MDRSHSDWHEMVPHSPVLTATSWLTNTIIREMQIKTTLRKKKKTNHIEILLQTCQNDFITKARNNKCWHGCGEKGRLVHCWWEWKLVQPLRITVSSFIKKLEIELPYNPASPLLDVYPNERKLLTWKDIRNSMFTVALFPIAKTWKQPDCPLMDGWVKETWNTHTQIHTYI